ncbi:MAG: ATPase family protein [uncultured bacterium]|nr:MAG: ATPase family protein [uncultured bacterium]OFW68535.1 MAG: ATPase [Alphaproteobacteria bacterium GWC2_42_16]OFW73152.1 MAG: ATPase [Alphaproteobacteria bacterium GWA2_41_27]OFW81700.1 MAG: ATPase [Alphaproteobacteria bacterium RIFCSPHIGHO2_12_FULL_42_100]OFW86418.1 MAG: ATPase [Alphaproteobacteria bacterium RBG_16_42_14]OFW90600.1 MAG: ATPase [Alphaproteobacteria bacterium RIFCSPHIGHO2_02_FULL_42_30]OFW93342.1 MAG: ATPase [Alphaproteobacteria bacterium RIFCSPHIGHO2_12_42_13]OFX02247
MQESIFIGRKRELQELSRFLKKRSASLIVVQGRRRIGKSRLIREFSKNMQTLTFSGIPPTEKTTSKDQLFEFGWQLGKALGTSPFKEDDWNDLFLRLAHHTREGRVIIVLDEISWMGSKDHNFLGKLKNAWDLHFKNNPELILIICGSASAWIEKNILSNAGFLGRISFTLTLEELPLNECQQFWAARNSHLSTYEKFKILSVTGGVPLYLEEIDFQKPAEENIKDLCFKKGGLLVREFEQIFSDLFSRRSNQYKSIVQCLADGPLEYRDISKKLGVSTSGLLSEYLFDLTKSGFVSRDYTWHLNSGKPSPVSHYRLKDNYLRFYLKYIDPNLSEIEKNSYIIKSMSSLPGWSTILGFQFENLVLNNREFIQKKLNLRPENIVSENPFFQHATKRQPGCQIDYLIQTRFNTLFACEIKFSRQEIKAEIIQEMERKLDNLTKPRGFSCFPTLIHVNGVHDSVIDSNYFSEIIDFCQIMEDRYRLII